MSDAYAHIPIHIRLTERWRIDPEYTPEAYQKHEHLLGLIREVAKWSIKRTIPDMVVKWVGEDPHVRLGPAAMVLQMEPEDLQNLLRRIR